MIVAQEKHLIKAREEFEALLNWIDQADDEGLRIDQVERGLFSRLLAIGFSLLEAYVAKFGSGDVGETVEQAGRMLRRSAQPHRRRVRVDLWRVDDRAFHLCCPPETENRVCSDG